MSFNKRSNGCSYVTSNSNLFRKIFRVIFVYSNRLLREIPSLLWLLCSRPRSCILFFEKLRIPPSSHCRQSFEWFTRQTGPCLLHRLTRCLFLHSIQVQIQLQRFGEKWRDIRLCGESRFVQHTQQRSGYYGQHCKKATTQDEVQNTHADASSTVNFSSNNRISFSAESQECQKKNKIRTETNESLWLFHRWIRWLW